MNKELYISSTPHETKIAVVEDDLLAEIHYERENEYTLAGSIYKGRVTRVLPGMQSAFVEIGLERDAFLYVTDFLEEQEESEEFEAVTPGAQTGGLRGGEREERGDRGERRGPGRRTEAPAAEHTQPVQPHLVHPEPELASGAALEPAPAEADGNTETDEDGVRRWRGRRRRGGRGRSRGGPEPRESREPREAREPQEARESREPREARDQREPREPREPRFTAPTREPAREQYGPPAGYQPIILPGESISKYRRQAQSPAGGESQGRTEELAEASRFESSAKFAERAEQHHGPGESSESNEFSELRPDHSDLHSPDLHSSEVHSDAASISGLAAVTESPAAHEHEEDSQHGLEVETAHAPSPREAAAEPQEEPKPRVWERFKRMNVAAIFGGGAAAPEPESKQPEPAHEAPHSEEQHAAPEHDAHRSAAFAPGGGRVEEEVIEEEEAELHQHGGQDDEEDFVDLEEEVLDRGPEGRVPVEGLTEAVRESGVEERSSLGDQQGEEGEGPITFEGGYEGGDDPGAEEAHEEAEAALEDAQYDRAEMRAPAGTAPLQQQPAQRPGFDRSFDRSGRGGRRGGRRGAPGRAPHRVQMISELLKEGQEILVQIAKEPIGKKGARITSHIALPGRFLVYMPTVNHIGVSRKISSDEERQRLKRIVMSERENGHGGFIVRTAADHAPEEELRADIRFLKNLWQEIKTRAEQSKAPALIYHDLNLVERILRDQVNENFTTIMVDTEPDYERLVRFVNRFQPALVKRVKLYSKDTPLFEQFNIQDEINKALKSKVWLKSGGYIVINQTEALVAIDVNTGKYVGKTQRLEDTIVKTNVDAIKEIVRQIRLRDLGGIIVIDFIDMDERKNRQKVMQALEEALRSDRAPSKVLQFNDFGLVAITRKRVKQSLERTLGTTCSVCEGTGYVKSVSTVCNEIWVEMRKMSRHFERADIMLRVHPEVAKALKANGGRWMQELEELTGRNVIVKSDPLLHEEQFDVN